MVDVAYLSCICENAENNQATPRHTQVNDTPSQIRRVLVVADQRPISDSLAMILSHKGFVAKTAIDGEEAIELAKVFLPDLLISDVVLCGITGIETANVILTFLPTCKVILLSGQATTLDLLRRNRTAQHFEVLPKPLRPDVLLQRIAELA
jgi:DNA-binding response OmpR family regulator